VKEFAPDLSLGGAYFTPGHRAMTLSDHGPGAAQEMRNERRYAQYYVGVRGSGKGSVRPETFGMDATRVRYELSAVDAHHLSTGLARLATLLLAGGAEVVVPSVQGIPAIRTEADAARWLDESLPRAGMSLITVHAFSSCPIGERRDRCAADSYGHVRGVANLLINDASMLPDSAGVNPQGTIMAIARRNALRFAGRFGAI
jgi:choline dehydrogenase-like flavoprotein